MKKTIIIFFCAVAVFACSQKTIAPVQTTTTTDAATAQAEAAKIEAAKAETAKAEAAKVEAAHAEMVLQGKSLYATRCTTCHPSKTVENYTATGWTGIMKSMAPNAKLSELETQQVTAYVIANAKK
ncbi:MAG: hypothetical protein V4676_13150 [Bacteroidota bacterium]